MVNSALHASTNGDRRVPARPLLNRLVADRSGNVLAIAAACIPPMLILVGSGVDMSRAYMTQASLQSACDAGVLAGRRAQAKSGAWGTSEQGKAQRMFTFNFQSTASAATNTSFVPTDAGAGVIRGVATTTIPTVLMQIFGTNNFTLTANCSAEYQVSNIDVMFVLDTTGSMACLPDGTNCTSGSTSKIAGLKEAVRQFYYTIASAVPNGGSTRVRFGFVPYSGTVNMGTLVAAGDIPSSYFTSSTSYQTKIANFTTINYVGTPGTPSPIDTTSSQNNNNQCNSWANANPLTVGGPPPANTTTTYYTKVSFDNRSKICTRRETSITTTNYVQSGYKITDYTYRQKAIDTTALRSFTAVPIVTAIGATASVPTSGSYDMVELAALGGTTDMTVSNVTWGGCIEERTTVNSAFSNNNAPTGAYDHDLASAPSNDSTRWHPYVGALVFDRGQANDLQTTTNYGSTTEYCVPAAMKFTTVDTTSRTTVPAWLETYIGTLVARGNTYHDIGMMWGARLANRNGIMSANVTNGNLSSVSRHIIMLTDGEMAPNGNVYNAYGMEYIDNRVAPPNTSDTRLIDYHNARFLAACQSAKNMGYTIWFVGFGQALTAQMTACASSGRAFYASDTATLQDTFRHIASQVADLRLKT